MKVKLDIRLYDMCADPRKENSNAISVVGREIFSDSKMLLLQMEIIFMFFSKPPPT